MRPKTGKVDRKHPEAAREAMQDIEERRNDQNTAQRSDIRYVGGNRDRALGEADRTGRHHDEQADIASDESDEPDESEG